MDPAIHLVSLPQEAKPERPAEDKEKPKDAAASATRWICKTACEVCEFQVELRDQV